VRPMPIRLGRGRIPSLRFAPPIRRDRRIAPQGVTPLLGVVALESLALMLNPVTRELLPMRLFLARAS
jgi:hypothetical protein